MEQFYKSLVDIVITTCNNCAETYDEYYLFADNLVQIIEENEGDSE
jgi:hypothetical protein